jgi:hypothetical protein
MLQIIFTLPGGFFLRMVAPLDLQEPDLPFSCQTDVFSENTKWSFPIGEIMIEVNGVMIYLLI